MEKLNCEFIKINVSTDSKYEIDFLNICMHIEIGRR